MRKSWPLVLLLVLLLTACGSSRNRNGEGISEKDYRTGTEGLQLTFMQNNPPDKVFAGSEMDVLVEVRNAGAYPDTDAFDGKLEIYGYDRKAFVRGGWDGSNFIGRTLQGKSQFGPSGGREVKQFHVDEVTTLFGAEFYEPTLVVAACYKYRTIAEPLVCIDPEPFTVFDENKVCTIPSNGKSYSLSNQGAPVAVTKVTEEVSAKNLHFGIYIQNVGEGKVVDENTRNDCPLSLDYNDVDRVLVQVKLPWDGAPRCQPRGDSADPVRLDESGNGYIYCTFTKPTTKSAFETILQVQVDYRYLDTIQKKIRIVNINR
ncbi:MAG: hypothetical protein Q7S65_04325 [Nanoarchaeota archaeon]|nr:hypothetical protein [Nanoarchaeota archaeon]